ncbi:hypothetical protein [Candidatus Poriferisodalis sp.]|uniref:hypothetical protein n=1 Tax=Candidatus Poriferisodalis sp. TaxID=3101277 RepID=UPI003C6ED73F
MGDLLQGAGAGHPLDVVAGAGICPRRPSPADDDAVIGQLRGDIAGLEVLVSETCDHISRLRIWDSETDRVGVTRRQALQCGAVLESPGAGVGIAAGLWVSRHVAGGEVDA